MLYEKINLYEYFGLDKCDGAEGFLTVYMPSQSSELRRKLRPSIVVLPGGGYQFRSDREAEPVAFRFMSAGYAAFVLDYTVQTPFPTPLIEACMAVAYVRENAERLGLDGNVAAIGFSAGGHLAGMLATMFGEKEVKDALGARAALSRPDAVIMSYPVVTMDDKLTHAGTRDTISGGDARLADRLSVEKRVSKDSAPAFIWHTAADDGVPVENSLLLASAYRKHNVPFALHIFERGWHGLSLLNDETCDQTERDKEIASVSAWSGLALDWLKDRGFYVKPSEA